VRNAVRKIAGALAGVFIVAVIAIGAVGLAMVRREEPRMYWNLGSLPARPVAIVFGAGLKPDQTPSAMLADRLDGAFTLYRANKVRSLLFTGDNGTVWHNELASMLEYALKHRIPRTAIALDYAGFNTRDSCYRAAALFHVHSAILVTQAYHMPRALYLCRREGIDAVGYARPDWGRYGAALLLQEALIRESLARTKAVIASL
jgi:vancomycin permeability regulator SanA